MPWSRHSGLSDNVAIKPRNVCQATHALLACLQRSPLSPVSLVMRENPQPDSITCSFCGYSLAGLPDLLCPECGTRYEPPAPPLPPLTFLDPVARAHVVCSINAILCTLAMIVGSAGGRNRWTHSKSVFNWGWDAGGTCGVLLNFVLLFALIAIFPRRSNAFDLFATVLLCVISLLVAAGASIH